MASVKVAVRVRPFNQREIDMDAKLIIQMNGKKTGIVNCKANARDENHVYKEFTFDHSYWSHDTLDPTFASQEQVYNDLGTEVVDCAFEGYNACVFAYGQTGSGKTFTMMGSAENQGLIPRICKSLFSRMEAAKQNGISFRTEVSYLEIYQERVMDLLRPQANHSLRVREHPRKGPYVQDLTKCLVTDYAHIQECMLQGNTHRTTASTNMNDVSSRSHAIFTITFIQASFSSGMPSETVSKIHLVDLAGSERANATGATGQRLKEGAHINKSLVTLGSVISALAECSSDTTSGHNHHKSKPPVFIPYRDSVLTWLLKDSLGGNSKTIMIAAISPADCNYGETLSTLRYANRAKNIINKPTINEDANVKLIRELREEINKLKALIELNSKGVQPQVLAKLLQKEAQEKVLTEEWTEKWRETQQILQEQKTLGLRKSGVGVVLDSDMPHLVGIDDDLLSTGVTLYHLKEGETLIGTEDSDVKQDIILNGVGIENQHCSIVLENGVATIYPKDQAQCWVNTVLIDRPTRLSQGCIILLGRTNMFRFNDPVEAAKLRKDGSKSHMNLSRLSLLSWSTNDLACSMENLNALPETNNDQSDELEAQRQTLLREKEIFEREQLALKADWAREQENRRKALEEAQQKLEEERRVMEQEHEAQCRRLEEDWRKLEVMQEERETELRERELELQRRRQLLEEEREKHLMDVKQDCTQLVKLNDDLEEKLKKLCQFVASNDLAFKTSPLSDEDAEYFVNLLNEIEGDSVIVDLVNQHKRELAALQLELKRRMQTLSEHRDQVDRIDSELVNMVDKQLAMVSTDTSEASSSRQELETLKEKLTRRTQEQIQEIMDRKRSLTLNLKRVVLDNNNSTTDNSSNVNFSPSLEPSSSPLKTNDTFHTATSACSELNCKDRAQNVMSDSGVELENAKVHASTRASLLDESDLSSTEDYKVPSDENSPHSSSSFEQLSPCHGKRKLRTRHTTRTGQNIMREEDAMRTMKRLFQRVAKQKMLIMRNLETDCSKEELSSQIAVLQELQRQYMSLRRSLQHPDGRASPTETSSIVSTTTRALLSPTMEHPLQDNLDGLSPSSLSAEERSLGHRRSSPMLYASAYLTSQSGNMSPYSLCITRSLPSIPNETESHGVVSVSSYVIRGTGTQTHYEYEVRISTVDERWTVLRRYRRFRDLHLSMKAKYGDKVSAIPFPPRQLFANTESVARQRRKQLETYLRRLLEVCTAIRSCPLHPCRTELTKLALLEFSTFFRKGVFENGKYGTS
ncbi:Kinesin-like protein at 98A [Carabus blaptoides fortunei]